MDPLYICIPLDSHTGDSIQHPTYWYISFRLMLACNVQRANNFSTPIFYNVIPLLSYLCHLFILVNEQSRLHCGATSLYFLWSLVSGYQPLAMLCWLKLCTRLQILLIRYSFKLLFRTVLYWAFLFLACCIEFNSVYWLLIVEKLFSLHFVSKRNLIIIDFVGTSCLWSE